MEVWIPVLSAFLGAVGGAIVAVLSVRAQRDTLAREIEFQRAKFTQELEHQRERLKAEFRVEESVEAALRHFLSIDPKYRSFQMIQHHIGGFESNELRRHLVGAGAVRFMAADGTEMWALRERVGDEFQLGRWRLTDAPSNKVSASELFPGALEEGSQ